MANIQRIITITEEGSKSGPYFDVYYSLDCINYTICSDGSNVYLPTIGSQVTVTLPDNSTCIKLQSLSPQCVGVYVVENLTTTTTTTTTSTTTTTTTAAPTTTTTTTAGPTTTTTTTAAPKFWNAIYCNNYQALGIPLKMAGSAIAGNVVQSGTDASTCAILTSVYVGTPFVFFDRTSATIYNNCDACAGITTTTTSTTTTTTPAPVWYTLTNCSTGVDVYSTQYPNGTFVVGQRVQYGVTPSILYFNVKAINYSDPGGTQQSVTAVSPFAAGCPTTTTTSTTTTLAPVRLALTASCSSTNNVLEASNFRGGNGTYQSVASGSSESNAFTAQQIPLSGASSYTFNNLPNGLWYVVLRDSAGNAGFTSASLSCNTTTTTSTTTTAAPLYYRALDCRDNVTNIYSTLTPAGTFNSGDRITANGGVSYVINGSQTNNPGGTLYTFTATGLFGCPTTTTTTTTAAPALTITNGSVTCSGVTGAFRSSFSGGSGTYSYVAYSNSQANAVTMVNSGTGVPGARVTLGGGATFYDWSGIANGTWYTAVKDSLGNVSVQNTAVTINCTTTTTTSTTTTTTLPPEWYNLYNCNDGSTTTSAQYPAGTFVTNQRVQYGTGPSILYFTIISSTTSNPGGIQWSVSASGGSGCPATTTTTTTTTLPPVDFTYTTSCSNGLGTIAITSITGGTGTGYQYSIQPTPGVWINYPGPTLSNLASGQYYNVAVRDSAGAGTNKSIYIDCPTTTTTSTTTAAPARVNVNFSLVFDAGNDGTLEIYSASPASAGYTLNDTLTFDGASYALSLLPGDGFYATITQTARTSSTQRGQISTIRDGIVEDFVVTGAGALPKSVSSTPTIITAGSPYFVNGLCGDQI
jgi:hypothetical protein